MAGAGRGGAGGGGGGALAIGPGGGTGGGAGGLLDAPGTNGGADPDGTKGAPDGPAPEGGRDGTKAGDAGDPNPATPDDGDGGVAVAVTGPVSSRRRGGAAISPLLVGPGGGGGGGAYGRGGAALNGCDPGAGGVAAAGVADRAAPDVGVPAPLGAGIVMTPLQTEHRARTPFGGTLAGSTRKIERQSGQLTFIHSLRSCEHRVSPAAAPAASRARRFVYPPYKLSQADSWRTSSFPSQVGSPGAQRSTYDANW